MSFYVTIARPQEDDLLLLLHCEEYTSKSLGYTPWHPKRPRRQEDRFLRQSFRGICGIAQLKAGPEDGEEVGS